MNHHAFIQFTLPWALCGLVSLPVFWWAYVRQEKTRWGAAFQLSSLATQQAIRQTPVWRRLVWPVSVTLLLSLLWIGVAGPTWQTQVATKQARLMLVLDISLSMLAQDMAPNRLTAATHAASQFVQQLPDSVRVGLLLFAGNSVVVSPPITDHDKIARFLTALRPEDLRPRTEIGSAIQAAKQAMALDATSTTADQVMLVLSDGDSREGYPWDTAATEAKAKGIRVNTVAIGHPQPTTITYQGQVLPVSFNPDTLRQVATLGGGQFFQALSAQDFPTIYRQLSRGSLHVDTQWVSLGPWIFGAALLVLLGNILVWLRFPWLKPDIT
jgi:Ca-activated chloride channel homolog